MTSPTPKQSERCPRCTYWNKDCPGGAHVFAQYEDGILTVEDYVRICKRAERCEGDRK